MIKKLFAITLAATSLQSTEACTNVIISTEASADGATLLGDNDDTAKRFGAVTHFAAATWPEGSTRDIYDFEGGFFRGVIAQPSKTVCIKCPVEVTIIIYFCCCCQI
jgi:hypothetical protein